MAFGRSGVEPAMCSPSASRVLTVGDGSTLEGVACTKPSDVLGVMWDRLAVPPCDTETHKEEEV